MENASKALIIAGAILLSILIIAIGIYIFNNAQSTIESSMTSISTQEKEAFNSMFTSYEGEQSGSNVKALIQRLVANFDTYKDEYTKVPNVTVTNISGLTSNSAIYNNVNTSNAAYVTNLGNIRAKIENKRTYKVSFSFGTNGLVDTITISDITK